MALNRLIGALIVLEAALSFPAQAFCGFYVGKADTQLFNRASQVALVRDGDRTVMSMSNDYDGPLTEFAVVVPVPAVLTKEQIHIGERVLFERLDAYSAPRLVEYFDPDPCAIERHRKYARPAPSEATMGAGGAPAPMSDRALGVTVEAQYTVGEYDIVLLSAKESAGLETWLRRSGYRIPPRAASALAPYIRSEMKFFVAKVNLTEQRRNGFNYLRPIQIAYEWPRFMLPIRLGMANADGPQDLIVYALTKEGRIESTNYRTLQVPSGMEIPVFVKEEFGPFYKATFENLYQKENRRAVFTEYVWNMGWCDPCAANPLSREELKQLGVFWLEDESPLSPPPPPKWGRPYPRPFAGGALPVTLTRLHIRYDSDHFPEDLMFQQTGDQQNFQARYILRHAWRGGESCPAAEVYQAQLEQRHEQEATTLANLTGWDLSTIRQKMGPDAPGHRSGDTNQWYQRLWK